MIWQLDSSSPRLDFETYEVLGYKHEFRPADGSRLVVLETIAAEQGEQSAHETDSALAEWTKEPLPGTVSGTGWRMYEVEVVKKEYFGHFDTWYETGMEGCMSLILEQDGSAFEEKNSQYDPADSSKGPEYYKSYDAIVTFRKGDRVTVYNKDGTVKYEFTYVKDREALKACNYAFDAIPIGFERSEWLNLFRTNAKGKIVRYERQDENSGRDTL